MRQVPGKIRKKATSEREEGRAKQRERREMGKIASEGERESGLCELLTKWTCRLMLTTC